MKGGALWTRPRQTTHRRPLIYTILCSNFISKQHDYSFYLRNWKCNVDSQTFCCSLIFCRDELIQIFCRYEPSCRCRSRCILRRWKNKRGTLMLNISLMFVNTTVQTWNTQVAADRVVMWHRLAAGSVPVSLIGQSFPGHTWARWSCVCQSTND